MIGIAFGAALLLFLVVSIVMSGPHELRRAAGYRAVLRHPRHGGNRSGGNAVADFMIFGRIASQSAAAYVK